MSTDLPRGDGIFTAKSDGNDWKSLDNQKVKNLWTGSEIPQTHMDFKEMMSRKEQTVAHGFTELKWFFQKSNDQILRELYDQARERHMNANDDKTKR